LTRRKFILIVGISGTVTVLVEAKDEVAAKAMVENFEYHLGCLEDAHTDFVDVEDAAPQDEPDKFVDAENPFFPGNLLLDRTEP
jgi:hypothetical protein